MRASTAGVGGCPLSAIIAPMKGMNTGQPAWSPACRMATACPISWMKIKRTKRTPKTHPARCASTHTIASIDSPVSANLPRLANLRSASADLNFKANTAPAAAIDPSAPRRGPGGTCGAGGPGGTGGGGSGPLGGSSFARPNRSKSIGAEYDASDEAPRGGAVNGRASRFLRRAALREAAFAHERVAAWIAPAERAVAVGRIDGVADGKDVLHQFVGDGAVVRTFRLGERLECVGRERVRPEVAVVAGRVGVAREDVAELWRPVTHHELARHAERRERFLLERAGVDVARAGKVELHVDEGARQVFDGRKTL